MPDLTPEMFADRCRAVKTLQDVGALLSEALQRENEYRRLFSTQRESWEVPEVTDPRVGLLDVYENADLFQALPKFEDDERPRCFELGERRLPAGTSTIVEDLREFEASWDCFTESQLRFLDWNNVFAAGGSVGACLAPLPLEARVANVAQSRRQRRAYFHDKGYPGSDVDLFLYGLDHAQAEKKLLDIFQAVQAANPYEVICFRSAHAVTMVSQYPFRHVQVVLRLYNSPAEVLMGFDVDACACGYDGQRVVVCPRAAMAFAAQSNSVDMSRRSPSYEMRLAKYAQRGFEVVVPGLNRSRVDPFIYEKRFDQVQGLARLLLLERLKTPEARFQYRQEQRLRTAVGSQKHRIQAELRSVLRDKHALDRMEGTIVATADGAEVSNYSTVFLPWGPAWTAAKVGKVMAKKDRLLNSVEFLPNGRVAKCTRKYRLHVCFQGTMDQILEDCFPDDPPIPADVSAASLQQCVRGRVSWLVDNPGRQQIGSFHPITEGDWTEGAYLSDELQNLICKCAADDAEGVAELLDRSGGALLAQRDFLGRSALHVAALAHSLRACKALLGHPDAGPPVLQARLADGRLPLHLAAVHGFDDVVVLLCAKRRELAAADAAAAAGAAVPPAEDPADMLDIDAADWELKLSPLQYAVVLGHARVTEVLLREGASVKKVAVHKDKNMSLSILSLCKDFACGSRDLASARGQLRLLIAAGASTTQVSLSHQTIWHELAVKARDSEVLQLFLEEDANKAQTLDVLDSEGRSPLYLATSAGNHAAVRLLLAHGATDALSLEAFAAHRRRAQGCPVRFEIGGSACEDTLRTPILRAVSGGIECMRAFLGHNPGLVHATCQQRGQRRLSLLDVAKKHLEELQGEHTQNGKGLESCQKRVGVATDGLSKQPPGSYGSSLWGIVLHQEQEKLDRMQKDALAREEAGREEAADAEAVLAVVQEHGGQPHPRGEDEGADGQEVASRRFGASGRFTGFGRSGREAKAEGGLEPLLDYAAIGQAPASLKRFTRAQHLPRGDQGAAHALFEAVWAGDAGGVRGLRGAVGMGIMNAARQTPLFVCALRGQAGCARAVLEVAAQQVVREAPDGGGGIAGDISSQLKRLNNLELACSGSVRVDRGRSPEGIRRQLEALEMGISTVGRAEEGTGLVQSKLQPHVLLMQVCQTKVGELPALKALLERAESLGGAAEEAEDDVPGRGHDALVPLHPLEVAIIRGDLPTLDVLLELLRPRRGAAEVEAGGAAADGSEEDADVDGEGEDTHGGDLDGGGGRGSGKLRLPEVRREILAHRNGALWSLDVVCLAAVMDRPEVFLAVAACAEEYALPLATMKQWCSDAEGSKPATWALCTPFDNDRGPTLLQLCLVWKAERVAELLTSGGADAALFGWLAAEAAGHGPTGLAGATRSLAHSPHPHTSARHWLVQQLGKTPEVRHELHARLLGPSALDGRGRTAIFYAPLDSIPRIAGLGPTEAGGLEQRMQGGLTPLLAAAAAGEEERVQALLDAGCCMTVTCGKLKWNALHLAVLAAEASGAKDKWARSQRVAEGLLRRASREEVDALLVAAQAEHTPLMLAIQKGAGEALVRLLAGTTAGAGGCGQVLARRDGRMSTALHLAAVVVPPDPAVVAALLDARRAAGPGAAGPMHADAEDARGSTPLELALNAVAQVWTPEAREKRNVRNRGCRLFGRGRGGFDHPQARGRRRAEDEEAPEATPAHRSHGLLGAAAGAAEPRRRSMVGFDAVQEAARRGTEEAAGTFTVKAPRSGTDADDAFLLAGGNLQSPLRSLLSRSRVQTTRLLLP